LENQYNYTKIKKLKVLEIITLFSIGGATETVISIASGLKNKSLEVDIIAGPNVELEGDMYDESNKLGLNVITIPTLKREIHPLYDLITIVNLFRIIKKGKYTVVHTHSSKAGILGRWAAWMAGCKSIVHTVHGWGFNDSQNLTMKTVIVFLEKVTAIITTKIVCVTSLDIEKGIKKGIGHRNQYTIIRSGIDLKKYLNGTISKNIIRKSLNINDNEFVIGTVTRFSLQKSPLDTILSFSDVINKGYKHAKLIMVGDGPLLNDSKILTQKLSLTEKIIFTGIRTDIPEILKSLDVFVLSSLWEGLPRVIIQAMASGIPVIATNIDGNSEIIKNGISGILTEPKQPIQMSDAIIHLIENPNDRVNFVENAKQHLIEFDENKMVEETQILYQKLISR
jgi:glycosyltransferase involved in cell wall biosynthesis